MHEPDITQTFSSGLQHNSKVIAHRLFCVSLDFS